MNSMMFVGTGGAFSTRIGNTAAIFEFNNTNLLIDCGHTVPKYIEEKFGVKNINNIFITHMHGDHIGGLEEIAFRNRYLYNRKCNLFIPSGIYDRLITYLEMTLKYTAEGICNVMDYFNINKVNQKFSINGYIFNLTEVEHIPEAKSYALIGKNFIYTGDTQFIDWTKWDLNGIDFIFQDTSLGKYPGINVHAPLIDLEKLPVDIKEKIYCMHYGDNIDDFTSEIFNNKMKIVVSYKKLLLE